jgi:glycosyltransferase involved in cell wall biosynthesis
MDAHTCARCRLESNGMPKPVAWIAGSLPAAVGRSAGKLGLAGGAWTALRTTELVSIRHSAARALFAEANRIVAVCEWVRDVLLRNGVDPGKIELSRQGLNCPAPARRRERAAESDTPLRIAFLGRLDAVKGLHVLIEALQLAPALPVKLDIFAVVQGGTGQQLMQALETKSRGDRRISFQPPIPADRTVDLLREYHVLAVPSQWMETGPMVVYEAFAAGTPVIGSRRGGIAELVEHEKNGLLVEASSTEAWANAIRRLVEDRTLLPRLKQGIGPVRTMRDVASEMQPVYARALAGGLKQAQSLPAAR